MAVVVAAVRAVGEALTVADARAFLLGVAGKLASDLPQTSRIS